MNKATVNRIFILLLFQIIYSCSTNFINNETSIKNEPIHKIFFLSNKNGVSQIFSINADGSEQKQISPGLKNCKKFFVSYDGTKIFFITITNNGLNNFFHSLFLINSDGSNLKKIEDNIFIKDMEWSKDTKNVVFSMKYEKSDSYNYNIYTMNIEDLKKTKLTNDSNDKHLPVWSPDSSKIAYVNNLPEGKKVFIMDSDGSHKYYLIDSIYPNTLPKWSPDGKYILFVSDSTTEKALYIVRANGDSITKLDSNIFVNDDIPLNEFQSPKWSPDGNSIIYTACNPKCSIYSVNINDLKIKRLIIDSENDYNSDWSPDGKNILYTIISGNNNINIATVSSDGNSHDYLKSIRSPSNSDEFDLSSFSYSHSINKIAYTKTTYIEGSRTTNLFIMDSDGKNKTKISEVISSQNLEWSNDDSNLAYTSNGELFVVDNNGENIKKIIESKSDRSYLSWSSNNRKIAFLGYENSEQYTNLYVVNSDGTDLKKLTDTNFGSINFSWVSDNEIKINYSLKSNNNIYFYDILNTNNPIEPLKNYSSISDTSSYVKFYNLTSPDGSKNTYYECNNICNLYLHDKNDKNWFNQYLLDQIIDPYPYSGKFDPIWSNDSKEIIFTNSNNEIYKFNVDNKTKKFITYSEGMINPKLSSDNRYLHFSLNNKLYRLDTSNGNFLLLTDDYLISNYSPVWR